MMRELVSRRGSESLVGVPKGVVKGSSPWPSLTCGIIVVWGVSKRVRFTLLKFPIG